MRIAVCMKCVPADLGAGLTDDGGIERSRANSRINQADLCALEAAVRLREKAGCGVDVYSMGPAFCEAMLREALALGADCAALICDAALAGSDTAVTAKALAAALGNRYALVLCGEKTVDGETGLVPGRLSALLDAAFTTGVTDLSLEDGHALCTRETERAVERVRLPLPAVAGVSCGMFRPSELRRPGLDGLRRARSSMIRRLNAGELGLKPSELGAAGSPTKVSGLTVPDWSRQCRLTEDLDAGLQRSRELLYGS